MPVNDFAKNYFVDFKDISLPESRVVENLTWKLGKICRCSNYLYLPLEGTKLVKFYARFRCGFNKSADSTVVFDGADLRENFGGKIIF